MTQLPTESYLPLLEDIIHLLKESRQQAVRSINAILSATYWEIGRRIVEHEQGGESRAEYGASLMERLSKDLNLRFGRGFSVDNLENMRLFYLAYPPSRISETLSRKLDNKMKSETLSRIFKLPELAACFPLSWSHYVLLVRRSRSEEARLFYETEALCGGWSVRQLERQINSQFYERTALSKNKAAMPTFRRPSSGTWRPFCWNWVVILLLSLVRSVFASVKNGTGSTWCFFIAASAASC